MALTLVTPVVTHYPALLPVGATATATNGMIWGLVGAPVVTRVTQNPMAWEEVVTSRAPRPTAASTAALLEPLTTPTPTLTTAAPPRCWLPVEAETAGRGQRPHGTVQPREAAGCSRGRLLLPSPLALQEREAWMEQVEVHLLTSLLETAAPTAWVTLDLTPGGCGCKT